MDEVEEITESIHQYVCENDPADPEIKSLGEEWTKLCEDMKISLLYVRSKMDDWFMEVYRSRNDLLNVLEDETTGRCQTRKDELYWKFFHDFETIIQHSAEVLIKIQMTAVKEKIKSDYGNRPGDWVDLAVTCVEKELELLKKYKMARIQTEKKQEAILKVEQDIQTADRIRTKINDYLKMVKSKVSDIQELYEQKDEKAELFTARQAIPSRQIGNIPRSQYFKSQLDQITVKIDAAKTELRPLQKEILANFTDLCSVLDELVKNLKTKVKEWQREFLFNYAELEATPDLVKIAPWCSQTGKIIHDILHGSLVSWQNTCNSAPNDTFENLNGSFQTYISFFQNMLTDFIKSTFVVTEQGNFFIKTGNKRFPKFSVRILAADMFSKHSEETTARFISEDDLSDCWDGNDLDLRKVEKKERKLKANKVKFSAENGKDKMECCFPNLQFAQGFKRTNKEANRQVHEEKYRVVFVTNIESVTCWTLSLPLVVTTASNQEAHSLASIMWQCYSSTDVFSPVNDMPEELPWSTVAEMLQKKMARLSTKHRLCQENITHLKNRLFGKDSESIPDEKPVDLTKFCWLSMEDTEFSFWKWFLGVYNLIEQYLPQFWHDGLIMGFVNKDRAEQLLEEGKFAAGTFILRFSDKHFTNSDGRKSVYGRLTSCVAVLKESKGLKRNSSSHQHDNKKLVFEHVDVADFKKLEGEMKKQDSEDGAKNNLANILKETWIKCREKQNQIQMYRFLYPSRKSREELFDKYCEEGTTVSGYKHTREAYIAILEQAMTKISQTRLDDPSTQPLADRNMKFDAANPKKPRRRDSETKRKRSSRQNSSCQSNISSPHVSPFHEQSPHSQSHSPMSSHMSPVYPAQSPYPVSSPAQSVPSPAFTMQRQFLQESEISGSCTDDKSRLPTFLKEECHISSSSLNDNDNHCATSGRICVDKEQFQQFDAMEITVEHESIDVYPVGFDLLSPNVGSEFTTATTERNISAGAADNMIFIEDYGGEDIICSQDIDSQNKQFKPHVTENITSPIVLTVKNTDGKLSLTGENGIGQVNRIVPTRNTFIDISRLTPEQIKQVNEWINIGGHLQTDTGMKSEQTPVSSGMCDIPVSTSSGSSGDLYDYSAMQLANMGSGDIDPNFAKSIVEQDAVPDEASDV